MGNCCCCAYTEGQRTNVATHRYPTEEHVPLSVPAHLVFGPNLDTSIPDTYRAPPTPMPYDVVIGRPVTPPLLVAARDKNSGGANEATDSDTIQESGGAEDSGITGDGEVRAPRSPDRSQFENRESENQESENQESENQESENQATERNEVADIESEGAKESDVGPSRPTEEAGVSAAEEEDACPICLDEYDTVNPKLPTRCEHHFHLACILAWMERSETCPVCDQEMAFDHPAGL